MHVRFVGGEVSEVFSNPVGFWFAICGTDGTVYMNPVPTEETLARLYNDTAYSFNWLRDQSARLKKVKPTNQEELDFILRAVTTDLSEERPRMLDVGCAIGSFMMTASAYFDVEGVDLSNTLADVARNNGHKVTTGRIQDVPGKEVFDLITMQQLIEHITDPRDMLNHAYRLVKTNGFLYISTPNIDSASFAYLKPRHIHVSSFGHVSLFNKRSLALLANKCGFELTAHEYYGGTDLALHDAVTLALSKERFRHRMSFYSPRLYHLCNFVQIMTRGMINSRIFPTGNESYQRALFKKRLAGFSTSA